MSTIVTRSTAQTDGTPAKGSPLSSTEIDTNFINLEDDKYQSGDDVSFGDVTATGDVVSATTSGITASGTVQGDATALTTTFNIISTATSGQGVILPTAAAGLQLTISNDSSADIKIYPNTSGTIDGEAANIPIDLRIGASMSLVGINSTGWKSLTPAGVEIYDSSGTRLN